MTLHRLAGKAIHAFRMWRLSRKDDPAIKELSRQVSARRRQHKRVIKDIQQIRTARLRAQFGRV